MTPKPPGAVAQTLLASPAEQMVNAQMEEQRSKKKKLMQGAQTDGLNPLVTSLLGSI